MAGVHEASFIVNKRSISAKFQSKHVGYNQKKDTPGTSGNRTTKQNGQIMMLQGYLSKGWRSAVKRATTDPAKSNKNRMQQLGLNGHHTNMAPDGLRLEGKKFCVTYWQENKISRSEYNEKIEEY